MSRKRNCALSVEREKYFFQSAHTPTHTGDNKREPTGSADSIGVSPSKSGINWGSIGLFRFDLVAWLFGGQTATVSRVIYTLVGLSALWCVSLLFRSDAIIDDEM